MALVLQGNNEYAHQLVSGATAYVRKRRYISLTHLVFSSGAPSPLPTGKLLFEGVVLWASSRCGRWWNFH
ncbi:MAG: hypothetical protein ACI8W8_000776 [Rhodothermales bacterium]